MSTAKQIRAVSSKVRAGGHQGFKPTLPAALTSTPVRNRWQDRPRSEFVDVPGKIDLLRQKATALQTLASTPDPSRTVEAHAREIEQRYHQEADRAAQELDKVYHEAKKLIEGAEAKARAELGVDKPLRAEDAAEIRLVLRGMTTEERDKLLSDAIENADTDLLRAVLHAPSKITTGDYSLPVDVLVDQKLVQTHPDLQAAREDAGFYVQAMKMAVEGFLMATDPLRDAEAAARAESQERALQDARNALASDVAQPSPAADNTGGDNDGGDGAGEAA